MAPGTGLCPDCRAPAVTGHAYAVLAALGQCAGHPDCDRSALISDDTDPTIRRCARHALEHLQRCERTRT